MLPPFHRWPANQTTCVLAVRGFNARQFATYFQIRAELLFQHPSLQFLDYSCSVHIHSCNFAFQLPKRPCIHCCYPSFKKSVHNTIDFLLIKLICALLRTSLLSFAETVWSEGSLSVPIYPFSFFHCHLCNKSLKITRLHTTIILKITLTSR